MPARSSYKPTWLTKHWATHRNAENQDWAALLSPQPDQFAVIDNRTVITGSLNWSPSAAHTKDETLLVIHLPKLAAHFTSEINRMWRGAKLSITIRMQRKLDGQRIRFREG